MDLMPFIRKGSKMVKEERESAKHEAAEKKNPALEKKEHGAGCGKKPKR